MLPVLKNSLSWLALGDSYTIGEGVPSHDNFPFLTKEILSKKEIKIRLKIIAKTGWTTTDLLYAIKKEKIHQTFDIVSLLIGVNNQYQQRSKSIYQEEFSALLDQAIDFANNEPQHVFVLSIPDYGQTPFAKEKQPEKISQEILAYNKINHEISQSKNVEYIDVYPESLLVKNDPRMLTGDLLHPSKEQYRLWSKKVADRIEKTVF